MKNCIKLLSIFVMFVVSLLPVNAPAQEAGLPFAPSDAAKILPHDCDGGKGSACTKHKWQSDYYGQPPYQSPVQPNPPVCNNDARCLYSTGGAASHSTINGVWICSWADLDGYQQGVWYQCEATRANAHKVIEGYECQSVGDNYAWVPIN
jgi:hypothetical protein